MSWKFKYLLIIILVALLIYIPNVDATSANSANAEVKTTETAKPDSANNNEPTQEVIESPAAPRLYYSGKAVVLTYHAVVKDGADDINAYKITKQRFGDDLFMLKSKGFNIITFDQMIAAINGNADLPDNAVILTFDDGSKGLYENAFPLLKEYCAPAVIFVITNNVETNLSISQFEISEMYKSGLVDIESHSNDSHKYVKIDPKLHSGGALSHRIYDPATNTYERKEDYKKRVSEDLNTSRQLIKKYVGKAPEILCFPYGDYNDNIIKIAEGCGFKYFVTTRQGVNIKGSRKNVIDRLNAGSPYIDSEKLFSDIVSCGTGIQIFPCQ